MRLPPLRSGSRKAALLPPTTKPTTQTPKPTKNSHSEWIKNRGQARLTKTAGSEIRHYYYDTQWRPLEERVGSSSTPNRQYTWGLRDRWDLLRRKRSTTNPLDETLYVLRDYLDPVAIADAAGNVVERYAYDAFGNVRFLDPNYASRPNSSYAWEFLFHGEFRDPETMLYNYGHRYYDTGLGRWLSRDPIGEQEGGNLYAFVGNRPLDALDQLGLLDIYSHSRSWVAHVGLTTYGQYSSTNWDFGRYAYQYHWYWYSGPNILRKTVGQTSYSNLPTFRVVRLPVDPRLERLIDDHFHLLFSRGEKRTPDGVVLPVNQRYMGSDWEPVNKNCNKFTFDELDRVLQTVGCPLKEDAEKLRRRLWGFSGFTPSEVKSKMDFCLGFEKLAKPTSN